MEGKLITERAALLAARDYDPPGDDEAACIAWLQRETGKLNKLLADPQPGLGSWCVMFGEQMEKLARYWRDGFDSVR